MISNNLLFDSSSLLFLFITSSSCASSAQEKTMQKHSLILTKLVSVYLAYAYGLSLFLGLLKIDTAYEHRLVSIPLSRYRVHT